MRDLVERRFSQQPHLFDDDTITTSSVADQARAEYEKLHELPLGDPDERERYYREHIAESPSLRTLRAAMDQSPQAQEIPENIYHRIHGKHGKEDLEMIFTPDDVRTNSPKTLSLVELKSQRDLDIFRKTYAHSIRIGDSAPGWEISYATEFHMTNDSKHFPPLEKWEAKGYKPDVFGRWIGPDGDVALPLYEGRMIGQFDFLTMSWVSGQGSAAVWVNLPFHDKAFRPRALIDEVASRTEGNPHKNPKTLFRDIARNTDTRTMIAAVLPEVACGHTVSTLRLKGDDLPKLLFLSAVMNSLCFDSILRTRSTGTHQSWFIIEECPLPKADEGGSVFARLAVPSAYLTFLHRRFASEWLRLKFFEIIGIPEMTTGPEPLIRKRDGCHRWKPEEFGKDDPRYGWTWDHCWQDAVVLLGSEEAVREYVEGKQTTEDTEYTEKKTKEKPSLYHE